MDTDSSDKNQRRIPEEKGPFGKARKRGTSRAKTPTQNSALDLAQRDNDKRIDDIFGSFKTESYQRSIRVGSGSVAALPPSASAPNLIDAGGLSVSFQAGASTNASAKEPKEVILYLRRTMGGYITLRASIRRYHIRRV
jgi:hypothetical protein